MEEGIGLSRRDFLKKLAAGAGVLATGDILSPKPANAEEEKFEDGGQSFETQMFIENLIHEYKLKKIDYSTTKKDLPPELNNLIKEVFAFQDKLDSFAREGRSPNKNDHKKIWDILSKLVPNLPAYSERNFYQAFVNEIPKLLINYGLAVLILPQSWSVNETNDESKAELATVVPVICLNQIEEIKTDEITFEGKTIKRNIVYFDDFLVDGINKNYFKSDLYTAHVEHRNIFINLHARKAGKKRREEIAKDTEKNATGKTEADFWKQLETAPSDDQNNVAFATMINRIHFKYYKEMLNDENDFDDTIAHETGHLIHWDSPGYAESLVPPKSRFAKEYKKNQL